MEQLIIGLPVLIFSVVLHEVAHGYAARAQGDPTAAMLGRLTLNPLAHIDPIGSVLVPGMLAFSGLLAFSGRPGSSRSRHLAAPNTRVWLRNSASSEVVVGGLHMAVFLGEVDE